MRVQNIVLPDAVYPLQVKDYIVGLVIEYRVHRRNLDYVLVHARYDREDRHASELHNNVEHHLNRVFGCVLSVADGGGRRSYEVEGSNVNVKVLYVRGYLAINIVVAVDLYPAVLFLVATESPVKLITVAYDDPYASHHMEDQRVLNY